MAIQAELQGAGLSAVACGAIAGSKSLTITAAGGTQGTATALSAALNIVTTCGSFTACGVILPLNQAGDSITVANATSNNLFVYPPVGAAFCGGTTNVPFQMAPNSQEDFLQVSATSYTN